MTNPSVKNKQQTPEGFFTSLESARSVLRDLTQHAERIKDYDKLAQEIQALKARVDEQAEEIKQRDEEVKEKETKKQWFADQLSKRGVELISLQNGLENKLKDAKAEEHAANSRKMDNMRRQTDTAVRQAETAKKREREMNQSLIDMQATLGGFRDELHACKAELDVVKAGIGLLDARDSLFVCSSFPRRGADLFRTSDIKQLAGDLWALANKYGGIIFDETLQTVSKYAVSVLQAYLVQDSLFRPLATSGFLKAIPNAIPISNSQESALLRTAALETIITKCLVTNVFHALFPWSAPTDVQANMFIEVLKDFRTAAPFKEAAFRSLINSTDILDSKDRKNRIIALMMEDVTGICAPLLNLPCCDRRIEFQEDFQKFFTTAVEVWNRGQRGEFELIAVTDYDAGEGPWASCEEPESMELALQDGLNSDAEVGGTVLFPQIFQNSPDDATLIWSGCVLWSDQRVYTAGREQYSSQASRIRSLENASKRRNLSHKPQRLLPSSRRR
jgi:hypothetical protein